LGKKRNKRVKLQPVLLAEEQENTTGGLQNKIGGSQGMERRGTQSLVADQSLLRAKRAVTRRETNRKETSKRGKRETSFLGAGVNRYRDSNQDNAVPRLLVSDPI